MSERNAADFLGPSGSVGQYLPGYEPRPGQMSMATLIEEALADQTHAIIEAGTGTGKSLAYLIPAILARGPHKRIIISTANKALQEQLVRKDIPFLKEVLPIPFTSALAKGRNNYLCLDRFQEEEGIQNMIGLAGGWSALSSWRQKTINGDFDDLPVSVDRQLINRIMSTTRTCIGDICEHFADCFVEHARDLAEGAQIVVCNHALLLADLRLRDLGALLLPDRDAIIIDEAHHLEDSAISALTVRWARATIPDLCDLPVIRQTVDSSVVDQVLRLSIGLFARLEQMVTASGNRERRRILSEPLPAALAVSELLTAMAESVRQRTADAPNTPAGRRQARTLEWISGLADDTRLLGKESDSDSVRYLEIGSAPPTGAGGRNLPLELHWAPIDVSHTLKRLLFDQQPVICASATLAIGNTFDYFQRGVGLAEARTLIVPSHFDYAHNCLLYVPTSLPEYPRGGHSAQTTDYTLKLAREVYRLVMASQGRAFCLFTSYRALQEVYDIVSQHLPFVCLKQDAMPRPELLRRFISMQPAVLFATRSFWEGVDVPGEALSLVIMDKMPFSVPDDPVTQARVARVKTSGGDWFSDLVLPSAVLQLKQGFGRLIRTTSDRGVVAILDRRLMTRSYGKLALDSLPPAPRTTQRADVRAFFTPRAEHSQPGRQSREIYEEKPDV